MNSIHNSDGTSQKVPWWSSCRLALSVVGMFGALCLYIMRANMSVAIICMTNDPEVPDDDSNFTTTPAANWTLDLAAKEVLSQENTQDGEFDWDRQLRGTILSSFYIGYFLTQVPGGWLANKLGAKIIIGGGMGFLTTLTLLTPVAARTNVYLLMTFQAFKGVASGVFYPAFYQLFGRWTTPQDRTFLLALFSSGASIGTIFSSILSGLLCEYGFDGGWPSIFYVFGIISVVWCVAWYFLGFSSPKEHPRITKAEEQYIQDSKSSQLEVQTLDVPWKSLLTSIPFYAIIITDLCHSWGWYVALNSLPQYMKDVLKFDIKENGLINSLPYLGNVIATYSGSILADFILRKQWLKATPARKLFQTLGMLPSAFMAVGVAFLSSDYTTLAVILLVLWVGCMGFTYSGIKPNTVEMAPSYSGVIMGICNTAATIPGIIAPPIVGAMTEGGSTDEWQRVFFLTAGINISGWLVYVIFAKSEEQEWARIHQEEGIASKQSKENNAYDNPSVDPGDDVTSVHI